MSDVLMELSEKALKLPAGEREQLADDLLMSLQMNVDAETSAQWDQEILHRLQEVKNGTAKLSTAAEVFAQARHLTGK